MGCVANGFCCLSASVCLVVKHSNIARWRLCASLCEWYELHGSEYFCQSPPPSAVLACSTPPMFLAFALKQLLPHDCRWNTLAAHDVGITLQLMPMLLGFFTYKAAVIAKTGLSLLDSISKGSNPELTTESSVALDNMVAASEDQSRSLDGTYARRVLTR